MSTAFAQRLEEARAAAFPGTTAAGACFFRRAVASEERRTRPAPPLPFPGLRLAGRSVAVLVSDEFPGGRFTRESLDDALAAARAAGAEWAAAWTDDPAQAAVLLDLSFRLLVHEEFAPGKAAPAGE